MYLFSNYLYYECDSPLLSDDKYDNVVRILENHYDELRPELRAIIPKGGLKTHAYMTKLDDEQKREAHEWVERVKKENNGKHQSADHYEENVQPSA